MTFALIVGDKLCNFIAFFRRPSQSKDQFKSSMENLELNLKLPVQKAPVLLVVLGDFNAKSRNWRKNDITTIKAKSIENISSKFGLHQVINEPTHVLESPSSYIDLIFTSQPNLINESGVHSSLRTNSHHQFIFAKCNVEVLYQSPHFRDA